METLYSIRLKIENKKKSPCSSSVSWITEGAIERTKKQGQ